MKESTPLLPSILRLGRRQTLKERDIGRAAHMIKDAVIGRQDAPYEGFYDPYRNEQRVFRNAVSIVSGRLVVQLRGVVLFSCWMLFLLTFFEPPAWCRDAPHLQIVVDAEDGDSYNNRSDVKEYGDCKILFDARGTTADEENQQLYPNSNAMLLTIYQSKLIEIACVCLIASYIILEFADDGFIPRLFFYPGEKRPIHTVQCLVSVCLLRNAISDDYASATSSPFLRWLILGSFLRKNHRELWTYKIIIQKMMLPLSLLAIIILFYAWSGVVIFHNSPEGEAAFPNLADGMWTLWTCVTTANYPDVMMPSFNIYRGTALYFISFMVLCYFYVMNLVLAVAVNAYDESISERKTSRAELSKKLLSEAFTLLDHNGENSVSRETIMHVMTILDEDIPDFQGLSDDAIKAIMFALLDKDGDNALNRDEFLEIDAIVRLNLGKHSDYATFVEVNFPSIYQSQLYETFATCVKSERFDFVVEVILILNLILVLARDYSILAGEDVSQDPHYQDGYKWEHLETIFTVVYVVEAMVKIIVNGWKLYIESLRNTFDFFITVLVVLATAYVYFPNNCNNHTLIQFAIMARVLRVGRLIFTIDKFRVFGAIPAEIIPAATNVFVMLFFTAYFFASLGMLLFGGVITRDPSNPAYKLLEATNFMNSGYWANNFNDMFSSLNVLFNFMVVNNWTTQASGMEHATGNKWLVRLFVFSFHLVGVIGISNVTTSLIIAGFFQQLHKINHRNVPDEKIEEKEVLLTGSGDIFDPSCINGTDTGSRDRVYSVRVKPKHRVAPSEVCEREILQKLFSSKGISNDTDRMHL